MLVLRLGTHRVLVGHTVFGQAQLTVVGKGPDQKPWRVRARRFAWFALAGRRLELTAKEGDGPSERLVRYEVVFTPQRLVHPSRHTVWRDGAQVFDGSVNGLTLRLGGHVLEVRRVIGLRVFYDGEVKYKRAVDWGSCEFMVREGDAEARYETETPTQSTIRVKRNGVEVLRT